MESDATDLPGVCMSFLSTSEFTIEPDTVALDRPDDATSSSWRKWRDIGDVIGTAVCNTRTFASIRSEAGSSFIAEEQISFITQVGEGTFSVVDQARLKNHEQSGQLVAIKRLRSMLIENDHDLSDFMREGALLKRLDHPCIVKSVGLGFQASKERAEAVDPGSMYIVQEFMTGGSLKLKVLQQMMAPDEEVYSSQAAHKWCMQIAGGLAHLHAQRPLVIHRDLKLENCLLTDDGEGGLNCKVADFGLHVMVQAAEEEEAVRKLKQRLSSCSGSEEAGGRLDSLLALRAPSSVARPPSRMQSSLSLRRELSRRSSLIRGGIGAGRVSDISRGAEESPQRYAMTGQMGSYLYMAPEVMLSKPYNEKVDIFSLGVIIFEVFAKSVSGAVLLRSGDEEECQMFAWKMYPDLRPTAAEVLQRLKELQASNDIKYLDDPDGIPGKCCCVQ